MKIESIHIGMEVYHPQYGSGKVKALSQLSVEVDFSQGKISLDPFTSGLQPLESTASLDGLSIPLEQLIRDVVDKTLEGLGIEKNDDQNVEGLGKKWNRGTLLLRPADPSLQAKDMPIETFFHKIVMLRNNLRVLEQKINAHEGLNDGEKVEMQQYISRCYGSLTSFNILFQEKDDQFRSK